MKRIIKRRALSILVVVALMLSNLSVCVSAAELTTTENQTAATDEAIVLDYGKIPEGFSNGRTFELEPMLFSNMYFTQTSSGYNSNTEILYLASGILRLAVYWQQHLYINDYDPDYKLLESRDIPLNVSGWGGMCLSEEASFVFYGRAGAEKDDPGTYWVEKYDADFNKAAAISLNDYTTDTLKMFGFSNAAIGLRDHTLTIFTVKNYSSTYSNYRASAIEIDVQKMDSADPSAVTFVSPGGMYLIDDPYRNILGFDGNQPIYALVSAADYPGGVYINVDDSISRVQPDTALGDNEYDKAPILTDATNMAVSSSHYLVATTFENYGINNIYLAVQEKETGNISGRFLTNATAFNSEINENPWIVDLGNDRFALLWERIALGSVNVCSVLLDASGSPMGQIQTWRGCALSSMVPLCVNDCLLWVTAENGKMELHQLGDLDASGYQELDNGIVEGDTIWNGTSDSSWYQGGKTNFTISTAEQLAGLAELVNAGNDFSGKTIRLENDLFMNSSPFGHIEGNQWIPIGVSADGSAVFNGTFDGQCHTIYNMVVPSDGMTGGVFGTIGTKGTVKCLTIAQGWFGNSACVADTNYGNVLFCMTKSLVDAPASNERGGVCRYNYGLIYGCQNYGFLEHTNQCGGIVYRNEQGGTISQCANKGLLYTYLGTFSSTGTSGIGYYNYGWIYNCYNLGVAKNGANRSAGIVGFTNGSVGCGQVYNCYSLSGYPLWDPIYVSKGNQAKVENCYGNTEPGAEWYEAFCKAEFLAKLDKQLGPMASAWLPDTLGVNNGLPIPVAEYNYYMGNYKVQPELWGVSSSMTVNLSEKNKISLSGIECYYSDATLEITSDNLRVAEIVGNEIRLYRPGSANVLFHLDETEESTALDYTLAITVEIEAPEAPEVKAANVASTGKIKLTWDKVDGAAQYQVYRATSKTGTYSLMKTTTGTSYTNTSAKAGTTYYYNVVAVSEDGTKSEPSSIVSRTCDLAQPVVTGANVASTGKIKLTWDAVDSAVEYQVYRSTTGKDGSWTLMKTTADTSYTNTSAKAGVKYYYKVRAIASKSAANSAYSSVINRTCDLAQPVASISNVASTGKIQLTWEAVDGAVSYKVYRSTTGKDGSWTLSKTTTGTSYTNTSAEAGKAYYYKVRAIAENEAANSAYSSVKSRTCDLARPDVSITRNSSGKPKLTWDAVDGAISYKVYRSTSKTGTYSLLKTTTSTSFTNTSAAAGTTYYYKVVAVHTKSAANSAYSSVVSIKSK